MTLKDWNSATVLVTGGHGFLGTHLRRVLENRGVRHLVVPTQSEIDLRDPAACRSLFARETFDYVFHLAASVGGIEANRKRPATFFHDNMAMGLHLISAAACAGVGRFVFLGTICAYPKFAEIPFREEDLWLGYPEETNAPYGVAKRALSVALSAYKLEFGLKYVAVFPTNLYGPGDHFDLENSHVIPALIRKCEEARRNQRREVTLWGSGTASRDFLYVEDAAEGIVLAAGSGAAEGETVNLGSRREVTIREVADLIARKTGFSGTFRYDTSKPDGQPRRCVSAEKAARLFHFKPRVTLEEGLERTVRWYRDEFDR